MSTINNRRKEPLSIISFNDKFKGTCGVRVEEYRDGIARISSVSGQWWVDVSPLVGAAEIVTKKEVSTRLNRQIPERVAYFGARC
jgi:hypothetical protein